MSWLAIVVAAIAIYLAFKAIGALFKVLLWIAALVALYWFAAPHLGLPQILSAPSELIEEQHEQPDVRSNELPAPAPTQV